MMTEQEFYEAIRETERQEHLFRLAGDELRCADWIMQRLALRAGLYALLVSKVR